MNNVGPIVLRVAGSCLPTFKQWQRPLQTLSHNCTSTVTRFSSPQKGLLISSAFASRPLKQASLSASLLTTPLRFRTSPFCTSRTLQKFVAVPPKKEEKGLAFQDGDLTHEELYAVYGDAVPPTRFANNLLRVLNGRRYNGTLDLPPPEAMRVLLKRYPDASDSALQWLRENYPMDEDAAIVARIEREDSSDDFSPAETQQRAQDLGLYGPQSGRYRAELSETEGDVFGVSEIDRIRAENILEAEKEEQELDAQINKLQAEVQEKQTQALAERPESGLESAQEARPPNEFEKWILRAKNRAQSKLLLDSPEVASMPLFRRLLPSAIFSALVCLAGYLFSQYWTPPKRSDRLFPEMSLSFATIGTLIMMNLIVYCGWSLPSTWRLLNRYFIATPAYPRALSMLGNVFSHQSFKHLLVNMIGLMVFGLSLHEDVGRGAFVGIYLASGVLGSLGSLANFAIRGQFVTSSLGASGSIWGVMAAYCWIHANEKFSFIFLPTQYQDKVQFTGWLFLSVLVASQIFGVLSPLKQIDYVSHVVGIAVGIVSAEWWRRNEQAAGRRKSDKKKSRWYEIVMGKALADDR